MLVQVGGIREWQIWSDRRASGTTIQSDPLPFSAFSREMENTRGKAGLFFGG
jgi:hypothetical protein